MNYLNRDFLRKLNPIVYERAADMIQKGEEEFSCEAVYQASQKLTWDSQAPSFNSHLNAYRTAFEPAPEQEASHPFWNKGIDLPYETPARSLRRYKRERITALCMMAALVRSAKS